MSCAFAIAHTCRFDIGSSGQQLHIAFGANPDLNAVRHLCFKVENQEALLAIQVKIWEHLKRGGDTAPLSVDTPGETNLDPSELLQNAFGELVFEINDFVQTPKVWNIRNVSLLATLLVIDWNSVFKLNAHLLLGISITAFGFR